MKETIKKLKNEIRRLRHLINTQGSEISRLSSLADYDFLTGIYNRQGFFREAEKFFDEFKKAKKWKERRAISFKNFSIIFIDLDNLKVINDEYGHKAGDRVIKAAAEIFQNSIRDFDVAARWGGDEFIIGLVGAGKKEAGQVAEKLKKELHSIKINSFKLSASFGIISAVRGGEKKFLDLHRLIEKADLMMYEAKKKRGKDFIIAY